MLFGTKSDKELALVLIEKRGFYDMPTRLGDSYYDWGDEIEPLVELEDILYNPQTFECDFLFDYRLKPTATMDNAIGAIISRNEFLLDLENNQNATPYDKFIVKLDSVFNRKKYGSFETATFSFYHKNPNIYTFDIFPQTAISDIRIGNKEEDGSGSLPDWYDFINYKMHVYNVKGLDAISKLKTSIKTIYNSGRYKLENRLINEIELDIRLVSYSQEDALYNLQAFKNLLSSPGLKDFYYYGNRYTVFCNEGFKSSLNRTGNDITFTVKLNSI